MGDHVSEKPVSVKAKLGHLLHKHDNNASADDSNANAVSNAPAQSLSNEADQTDTPGQKFGNKVDRARDRVNHLGEKLEQKGAHISKNAAALGQRAGEAAHKLG